MWPAGGLSARLPQPPRKRPAGPHHSGMPHENDEVEPNTQNASAIFAADSFAAATGRAGAAHALMPPPSSPSAGRGRLMRPLTTAGLAGSGQCPPARLGRTIARPSRRRRAARALRVLHARAPTRTRRTPQDWWRLYNDPVLDRLIVRAFAANTDLRVAEANLSEARAVLRGSPRRPPALHHPIRRRSSYGRSANANAAASTSAELNGSLAGTGANTAAFGPTTAKAQLDLRRRLRRQSYEVDSVRQGAPVPSRPARGDAPARKPPPAMR